MVVQHNNDEINNESNNIFKSYNEDIKSTYNLIQIKQKELENLNKQLETIKLNKYMYCSRNIGHSWIRERESGMYGELFHYCKHCGCGQ